MSDSLFARESEILGGEFSSHSRSAGDDIDFDLAASAFPDISLDGEGDIPIPTQLPSVNSRNNSSSFSFDDFDTPPARDPVVKVTGDDEVEKFENEFPDIEVPSAVSYLFL